eukprot:CAMPEP_0204194840 /NCGR_PEP_ID=MMETSP0361-20130328/62652_1 /ASSEMBLY_ACC=CAM_ASM_000343 /TAXON_ID=268821 /ORGANISM="Scrippsiella Hangoei, Strain SHTV-5" /LENGTH=159 /DNA_ID=CAMNT_0051156293 /DNA_START=60 /DNA_END=539 /DNA_ORIENTATION=-
MATAEVAPTQRKPDHSNKSRPRVTLAPNTHALRARSKAFATSTVGFQTSTTSPSGPRHEATTKPMETEEAASQATEAGRSENKSSRSWTARRKSEGFVFAASLIANFAKGPEGPRATSTRATWLLPKLNKRHGGGGEETESAPLQSSSPSTSLAPSTPM